MSATTNLLALPTIVDNFVNTGERKMRTCSQWLFEVPVVSERIQFVDNTAHRELYSHQEVGEELETEWESKLKKFLRNAAIPIAVGLASLPGAGSSLGRAAIELVTGGRQKDKTEERIVDDKKTKPVAGGGAPKKEPELEWEAELRFLQKASPNVLMELLASNASEAQDEAEASHLIKSLLPFVLHQLPDTLRSLSSLSPNVARALVVAVQALHGDSNTRFLIRVLPTVLQRTISKLNWRLAQDQIVRPGVAVQIFKHEISLMLSKPEHAIQALKRSDALLKKVAAAYNNFENLESEGQWLFELPFFPLTNSYANFYTSQENYVHPEFELETPDAAVAGLCTAAKPLANKLRSEIQNLKSTPKIKDPRQREYAIQGVQDKGKEWINRQVRNSFAIIDRLHSRDLDLLYGCLAQVSIAIDAETEPLKRLRGEIQKRLVGKGI